MGGFTWKFHLEKWLILHCHPKSWARDLKNESIFIFQDEEEKISYIITVL